MTQNVERILARGENLDHLRNKTEDLEATVRLGENWELVGADLWEGEKFGWGGKVNRRDCRLSCLLPFCLCRRWLRFHLCFLATLLAGREPSEWMDLSLGEGPTHRAISETVQSTAPFLSFIGV